MIGYQLAHYRIDAEIGRGGMGIVYRAFDTKLDRTVALKVLPASALSSEDDRTRFYREAKAAAQLQHPHIATVFEIGDAIPRVAPKALSEGDESVGSGGADSGPGDGPGHGTGVPVGASDGPRPYIAMEFVDGVTLSHQIAAAPLKITEVVRITLQVAEALKAAHAKGIVHRDIKSSNIMLTLDGTAKVLDFGLAKTAASTMLTRMGSTLGTVAYMSPEQARGEEVDGRTDLYALGTVVYEMVAGRLPFVGDYEQAVLYGILNEMPEPLTALRTGVPMGLEFLVNKCLSKDRELRYQTAADLMADLKSLSLGGSGFSRVSGSVDTSISSRAAASAASSVSSASAAIGLSGPGSADPSTDGSRTGSPARPAQGRWSSVAVVSMAVVTLVAGLAIGWLASPADQASPTPIRRLTIAFDGLAEVVFPTASADGRYWAFRTSDSLSATGIAIHDARYGKTTIIPESSEFQYALFSPSGKSLLLQGGGTLARVVVPDGRPIDLGTDYDGGVEWLDEEHIVQAIRAGSDHALDIFSIADLSRTRLAIHGLDSTFFEVQYLRLVPGTDILIGSWNRVDQSAALTAIDMRTGDATVLKEGACCAVPVSDHNLVFLNGAGEGQLVAQGFDPSGPRLVGAPVDLLAANVDEVGFGVGLDGSLMIGAAFVGDIGERLTWLDPETGRTEDVGLPVRNYDRVSLSPDARRAAIERRQDSDRTGDIYIMNLEDGTEQRFTYNHPINRVPVWARNGNIYFAGGPQGNSDIFVKRADGSGLEELVVRDGDFPTVSEDGNWVAFVRAKAHEHVYAINLVTGQEVAIDTTELKTTDPTISPNGRYIAFSADPQMGPRVSQQQQVYVRSFPDPSQLYQLISDGRGDDPVWSPDGKWLYYRSRGQVYRVAVNTEGTFQKLSLPEAIGSFGGITVRLSADRTSSRLLVVHPGEAGRSRATQMTLYEGFPALLDELIPSGR